MSETLSVIITADNKEALKAIEDVIKGTEGLQTQFKRVGSSSNEANQALINSGRVLQDLNYGFMGIANNLNPLLESFQRLSEKSKGNTSVMQELKSSLMGAGGIGLALSAATFIILKWGDAIGEATKKLFASNEVSKEYKATLESIGSTFTSAVEKVNKVEAAFNSYHKGVLSGQTALKIYNETLGQNFGVKKDINEAEKVFQDKTQDYIKASFQRALADAASKKAAEELLKQKLLEQKPLSEYKSFVSGATVSGQIDVVNYKDINKRTAQGFKDVEVNAQKAIVTAYQNIFKTAQTEADRISQEGGLNFNPDKVKSTTVAKEVDYKQLIYDNLDKLRMERLKKRIEKQDTSYILGETPEEAYRKEKARLSYFNSKAKDLANKMKEEGGIGDILSKMAAPIAEKNRADDKEKLDALKAQDEAYKQFAQTIAQDATSAILGLWDAMQKGEDIGKALGDMFGRLAEKIAAAVIQAALFQLIASALGMTGPVSGASTTTTSGGGFLSTLGGILGIIPKSSKTTNSLSGTTFTTDGISGESASGGSFVLKGNDLVLSLTRSNASLNLRRGS